MQKFISAVLVPIVFFLWIAFAMVLINGCNSVESNPPFAGPGAIPGKQLNSYQLAKEAYKNSVYEILKTHCTTCHQKTTSPFIASENLELAYTTTKNYVNFNQIAQSVLVLSAEDAHCGPICTGKGSGLIQAISVWWNTGEAALANLVPLDGITLTGKLLPGGNSVTLLQWNLGTVALNLQGRVFSVEVERLNDLYLIRNPTLSSGDSGIRVSDLRILINGIYQTEGNVFSSVDAAIGPNETLVLSSETLELPINTGISDVLYANFSILE